MHAVTGKAHLLGLCRRVPNLPIRRSFVLAMARTTREVVQDVKKLSTLSELVCRMGIRSNRTVEFKGRLKEFAGASSAFFFIKYAL